MAEAAAGGSPIEGGAIEGGAIEGGGLPRLAGPAVERRLAELDALLSRLEQLPGPAREPALDAIAALTAVYGEALARVMDRLGGMTAVTAGLAADELLGHLFILHGVSPAPAAERAATAVAQVRPAIQAQGGDVRLLGVTGGVARVEVTEPGGGCHGRSPAASAADAVTEAILTAAPELAGVEAEPAARGPAPREPALIPVEAVLRSRPVSA
jgi:Fe-S cluster biogenesis protein NfuA